jgi:spore coat protein U-like protein
MRFAGRCLALVVVLAAFSGDRSARATTVSGSLSASLTVIANCQFNTSPTLAFGNYDALSATAVTGSANLSVTCTKDATAYVITINPGANGAGTGSSVTRAMKDPVSGNTASYNLYQDSGYSTVWGTTTATGYSFSAAGTAGNTIPVYGKVPASQNITVGTYTDALTVTANF